nr:glycosyltransferase [Maliibacterium massiliense]
MKRLAIFQSDLHVGGIQKSLVNLLHMLPASQYEVDVFLFDKETFFDIDFPSHIHLYFLKALPYWNRLIYFDLLHIFHRRPINTVHYDVAIDFSSYQNECALGAINAHADRRVMWIHSNMSEKRKEHFKYRLLFHFFKRKLRFYDAFAAVSEGIVAPFRKETGIVEKPVFVIPNPIDTAEIIEKSRQPIAFSVDKGQLNLVSMGRLYSPKGYDILLDEFAQVHAQRHDMHLYIIGDGPDRSALEKQRDRLGLHNVVTFLGNQANPYPYLDQMDAFVLDSRYEGQGMVLWEAKALGLPLYMPKRLESSNPGLTGYENMVAALLKAQRVNKQCDCLDWYNQNVLNQLKALFESDLSQ